MDEETWTQINQIWLELNRPSAERLNIVLRERGINVRLQNLRDFLRSRPERQVFAARPLYKGRVYAADKDQRWAADIIVYDRNPAELDGRTYTNVLLVQDIFTRYAWAELMESRNQATEMFQRILDRAKDHRPPHVLTTDSDSAFLAASFQGMLRRNGIVHVLKKSREDISTVDRLIGTIRRALAIGVHGGDANWAARLQQVMAGYNKSPHRRLFGESPAAVSKPPETERQRSVIFDLRYQGAKDMEFNQDRIDKRREKLKKAGGFRTLVRRGVLNRRVYNTVWSDKIHMLRDFDETGAFARDTDDHLFPTKDVLPVDVPEAAQEQGEAPVEQEAVDEPQPPTPMSRPSSVSAAPSDRRREMISAGRPSMSGASRLACELPG